MSHITIMLDGTDAVELGEALIDAGVDAQSTGDSYSVEFIRSMAVALPITSTDRVEISREQISFEVLP